MERSPANSSRPGEGAPGLGGLLAVSALSLLLNLAGLTWGLPARWHPDEKADQVLRMARERTLAPDSFINPSLPLYAMLPAVFLQDAASSGGDGSGLLADPLVTGRALSALAGAVAVFGLGLLTRRHGPALGLLPPLFLALSPAVVNLCHFATPEAWLLLGTVTTLGLCLEHVAGRGHIVLLGLALGLTCATKYTAAALAVPVIAAILLRDDAANPAGPPPQRPGGLLGFLLAGVLALAAGALLLSRPGADLAARLHLKDARLLQPESALAFVRGAGRGALFLGMGFLVIVTLGGLGSRVPASLRRLVRPQLLVVLATAAAGFLLGTPFAVARPLAFLSDLAYNAQTRIEYKGLTGEATSYVAYAGLLVDALTLPVLAAAVVGLGLCVAGSRRSARGFVMGLGFMAPYLLVASSGHRALRFLAPALPAAAWLAAVALESLRDLRSRRVVTAAVLARQAVAALLVCRLFFVDSRRLATRFLEEHVPAGATIDLIANHSGYAPAAPEGRTVRVVPTLSREMAPVERFLEAARRYPEEASPWLVLTASFYERFLDHPTQQPERAAFFRDLLEGKGGFQVEARFRQQGFWRPANEFLDPEIVVLRKR